MSKKNIKDPVEEPEKETTVADEVQEQVLQEVENQSDAGDEKERLQREVSELKDKYLRLLAEFDNFKKRGVKERIDLMNTAAQDTLTALLPVLDDFDRSQNLTEEQKETPAFREGIQLVYQKLYSILKQRGLEPMTSIGDDFDPELHEALTEIPAPSDDLKGKVVDIIEKGYSLKGKIIRHAKVVVGK